MTFHPILYSLETIAHLQSQQKMIYQNGLLQVDGRYLRDFRRNWQGFSRYELLQPIRIYFYYVLNLCYISQTKKSTFYSIIISSNLSSFLILFFFISEGLKSDTAAVQTAI